MNEIAARKLAAQYGFGSLDDIPDDPGPYGHVWTWFLDLHARRKFDGAAGLSQPIGWDEIKAWCDVMVIALASHEIRILVALDNFFISEERKARAAAEKKAAQSNKSKARKR